MVLTTLVLHFLNCNELCNLGFNLPRYIKHINESWCDRKTTSPNNNIPVI